MGKLFRSSYFASLERIKIILCQSKVSFGAVTVKIYSFTYLLLGIACFVVLDILFPLSRIALRSKNSSNSKINILTQRLRF